MKYFKLRYKKKTESTKSETKEFYNYIPGKN